MSAMDLARLRAARLSTADSVEEDLAVGLIGRTVVRTSEGSVLGRSPDAPSAIDLGVRTLQLAPSALVAFGLCLGLAWQDRQRHPFPGAVFQLTDLLAAARVLGIEYGASRHLVGALGHVLSDAGLVISSEGGIRLGPQVAAWTEADLDVLRRNIDAFPDPVEGSS